MKGIAVLPFVVFACLPSLLPGIIGWKQVQVVPVIKKAYSLWRAGSSVRVTLSAATGSWIVGY